jgi:nucleoside-diphosphate-sugar epimerase
MSKVAIIGAGPVGLCVALALSKAGHRVSLVSDGHHGAGWAAGGMLAPRYEVALETGVPVDDVAEHGHWLMDCADAAFARWDDLTQLAGAGPAAPVRAATSAGIVLVRGDRVIDPRLWLGLLDRMVRAAGVSVVEGSVASVLPGTLSLD